MDTEMLAEAELAVRAAKRIASVPGPQPTSITRELAPTPSSAQANSIAASVYGARKR